LPEVHRRRESGALREVLNGETRGKRPNYYLQNFHFQSGGWMTADSAKRYDTQVEVVFNGTANAIRRQALPPLHEVFTGHDQRRLGLLDVGCGTGRFLDFVKQAWPRLPVIGLDMSEAYLKEAKHHLARWSRISLIVALISATTSAILCNCCQVETRNPMRSARLCGLSSMTFTHHQLCEDRLRPALAGASADQLPSELRQAAKNGQPSRGRAEW
jgi:SAM-dependent methyltransferase